VLYFRQADTSGEAIVSLTSTPMLPSPYLSTNTLRELTNADTRQLVPVLLLLLLLLLRRMINGSIGM